MRLSRNLLPWLLSGLPVPVASATPAPTVALVADCGPPALAAFVAPTPVGGLRAVTLSEALTAADGSRCAAPALVPLDGGGPLPVRVVAERLSDGLVLLEVAPGHATPGARSGVALPRVDQVEAAASRGALLRVITAAASGDAALQLARLHRLDLSRIHVSWAGEAPAEVLPGAPVLDDDGFLLGLLSGSAGEAARGVSGHVVRTLVDLHAEVPPPTPPGRVGIWLARVPGDPHLEAFWGRAWQVRRAFRQLGMGDGPWEIRDLRVELDGPPEQVALGALRHGASVNAAVVVASAWGPGGPGAPRQVLLVRPGGGPTGEPGAGAPERLLLPADVPREVGRATALLAAGDLAPAPRSLARAERLARRLLEEALDVPRAASGPGAPLPPRVGTLALLLGDLRDALASAGARPPEGGATWAALAFEAWTLALEGTDPARDPAMAAGVQLRQARALQGSPEGDRAALALCDGALALPRLPEGLEARLLLLAADLRAGPGASAEALRRAEADWRRVAADVGLHPLLRSRALVARGRDLLARSTAPSQAVAARGAAATAAALLDPDAFPEPWAEARLLEVEALLRPSPEDRGPWSRAAVGIAEGLLSRLDPGPLRARTWGLLGAAQVALTGGDRAENLARAEGALREALATLDPVRDRDLMARSRRLLGMILLERPSDDPVATFQEVTTLYEAALEAAHDPVETGRVLLLVGDAAAGAPGGTRSDNLQRSEARYVEALAHVRGQEPGLEAAILRRLARTWRDGRDGDRDAGLRRSLEALDGALALLHPEADAEERNRVETARFLVETWQVVAEAERTDPGSVRTLTLRGEACLQEVLFEDPGPFGTRRQALLLEARHAFGEARRLAPADPAVLGALALTASSAGDWAGAAEAQAALVALRPDDPQARQALDLFRLQARVRQDPGDGEARRDLARLYDREGLSGDALRAWRRVLAMEPGNVEAVDGLLRASRVLERTGEAGPALETALVHQPGDRTLLDLAIHFYLEDLPDPDRALALAEDRVARYPQDPDATLDLVRSRRACREARGGAEAKEPEDPAAGGDHVRSTP